MTLSGARTDFRDEFGEPATAAEWLIALREQPDDERLQEAFEIWLAESPQNQTEWQQANDVAALLKSLPFKNSSTAVSGMPGLAPEAGPAERDQTKPRRKSNPLGKSGGLFLGGIAALCLMITVIMQSDGNPGRTWETATAETLQIELEDGSKVTLAPESEVSVDYSTGQRQVSLAAGNAFFDVTPDPKRPFVVTSDALRVTVLGTAFEMRRGDDGGRVSVEHGRVAVDALAGGDGHVLQAGDRLAWTAAGGWQHSSIQKNFVASWRKDLFIANDDPLPDLVDALAGYHRGYIIMADDALRSMRITGMFNLNKPQQALAVLSKSHKVKVQELSPWLILVSSE